MKYVALKDVCKINMGQSPDSSSYNENGEGIPFFQGNADFGERYPVTRVWCNAPTKIAQSEDILISVRAPIGALNYSKEKCCIGRGLAAITPDKSKVSLEFVYWFLKGKNAELKSKGTGSTFKAISKKILEEILIPDVGFDKQHEYAQMLEKIYVIIQTRKQGLQKLDELIQSRFVEMFGDIITGKYNYKIRKLGDVAFIGSSHRVFTTEFVESGIPFYRGTEIGELANGIEPSEPYYISEEHYNKLTKDNTKPRIGDLLMPSICNKGQIWMVDTDRPFYYKDGRVLCISPNRDIFNSKYLEYFMRIKTLVEYPKLGSGSTFAEFKIFLLKDMDVLVPPRNVQNQFADFVASVDKSKSKIQKSLEETQRLFDSLMQKYFG
jgi:type I restriction enzyme S subunit